LSQTFELAPHFRDTDKMSLSEEVNLDEVKPHPEIPNPQVETRSPKSETSG
jgi:hypothetical protein